MKLVLFDIDGTLLWTDGAGRRAIQRALVDEAGTAGPIDRYRFDGKTDPQIVQDLLSLAVHAGAENATVIQAVCRRYVDHLRVELDRPTRIRGCDYRLRVPLESNRGRVMARHAWRDVVGLIDVRQGVVGSRLAAAAAEAGKQKRRAHQFEKLTAARIIEH